MYGMKEYKGYEVGPIRPPSEGASLLIRVTRNCPWNKCTFCSLYKGTTFSIRPFEHVLKDIENIKMCIDVFKKMEDGNHTMDHEELIKSIDPSDKWLYRMAKSWYSSGMRSIFLQDANSLVIKPDHMAIILRTLRESFPDIERITCYARSQTVEKIDESDLKIYAQLGLNRIHIGMESASDLILTKVHKGVNKEKHILAGQKLKRAGIELSEYFMPGLGGREYARENALETADAINQINPDYLRIRTLAVTPKSELIDDYKNGTFTRANDVVMVKELHDLVSHLEHVTTTIKSDHLLNLLSEFEGKLPEDRDYLLALTQWFLDLPVDEQNLFRVGRRTGLMHVKSDLQDEALRDKTFEFMKIKGIDDDNIDQKIDELMNRFI